MPGSDRTGRTEGLAGLLGQERTRILAAASGERRAQMRAAERRREVFAAWNAVVAGTREGAHVTGLHYLPESNELLVYMAAGTWAQEMTMLREILRARMALKGAEVSEIIFKASPSGYVPRGSRPAATPASRSASRGRMPGEGPASASRPRAARADLSPEEEAALDAEVSPIGDAKLKEALRNAMRASLEWKKGEERRNGA